MLVQGSLENIITSSAYTELLLILKLFAKLTDSDALVGQDLLRVRLSRQQEPEQDMEDVDMSTDADCSDALDLACQILDVVSQESKPLIELLGTDKSELYFVLLCDV